MPRGVPLTPAQVATLAEVYASTGNASEAARAAGVDVSTATAWVRRQQDRGRAHLHERACERGLRKARRSLDGSMGLIDRILGSEGADGPGIEPKDIASLAKAQASLASTLLAIEGRTAQRKQSKLTREKTRAETELIRRRIEGTLPPESVTVTHDARDELAARFSRILRPGATGAGDPPPDSGAG
jgi:hypothetical protein